MPLKKIPKRVVVILILLGMVFLPSFSKYQKLVSQNRELEERIKSLQEENAELSQQIYWLQNDPLYLEKIAREEMKLGQDGEIIYKVSPQEEIE